MAKKIVLNFNKTIFNSWNISVAQFRNEAKYETHMILVEYFARASKRSNAEWNAQFWT